MSRSKLFLCLAIYVVVMFALYMNVRTYIQTFGDIGFVVALLGLFWLAKKLDANR